MKRIALAAVIIGSFATGMVVSGCFTPVYSDCAFRCASEDPKCPAEYECRSDGYCHLPDGTAICAIPRAIDLSSVSAVDLSSAVDLADPGDAATTPDGM
ncbi:MAG: hypothetical protein U0787_22700 [Polyangia bacterium]|jgi:hypothetical protein